MSMPVVKVFGGMADHIVKKKLTKLKSGVYVLTITTKLDCEQYEDSCEVYGDGDAGVMFFGEKDMFGITLSAPDIKYPLAHIARVKKEITVFIYETNYEGHEEVSFKEVVE